MIINTIYKKFFANKKHQPVDNYDKVCHLLDYSFDGFDTVGTCSLCGRKNFVFDNSGRCNGCRAKIEDDTFERY